ncbi:MAG: phosphoribosyl-ATP diphosphatase [Pirellulales bacterium]|nr:phosphoribosyl-ATP diphosphatase [Pirellulales bacterium]
MASADDVLDQLMTVINGRKGESAETSYTAKLLAGGVDRIGAKVTEEAAELVEAAGESGDEGREHFIYEAADLVYHAMVLLAHRDVSLDDVRRELVRRFGVSGLEEKASRDNSAD